MIGKPATAFPHCCYRPWLHAGARRRGVLLFLLRPIWYRAGVHRKWAWYKCAARGLFFSFRSLPRPPARSRRLCNLPPLTWPPRRPCGQPRPCWRRAPAAGSETHCCEGREAAIGQAGRGSTPKEPPAHSRQPCLLVGRGDGPRLLQHAPQLSLPRRQFALLPLQALLRLRARRRMARHPRHTRGSRPALAGDALLNTRLCFFAARPQSPWQPALGGAQAVRRQKQAPASQSLPCPPGRPRSAPAPAPPSAAPAPAAAPRRSPASPWAAGTAAAAGCAAGRGEGRRAHHAWARSSMHIRIHAQLLPAGRGGPGTA